MVVVWHRQRETRAEFGRTRQEERTPRVRYDRAAAHRESHAAEQQGVDGDVDVDAQRAQPPEVDHLLSVLEDRLLKRRDCMPEHVLVHVREVALRLRVLRDRKVGVPQLRGRDRPSEVSSCDPAHHSSGQPYVHADSTNVVRSHCFWCQERDRVAHGAPSCCPGSLEQSNTRTRQFHAQTLVVTRRTHRELTPHLAGTRRLVVLQVLSPDEVGHLRVPPACLGERSGVVRLRSDERRSAHMCGAASARSNMLQVLCDQCSRVPRMIHVLVRNLPVDAISRRLLSATLLKSTCDTASMRLSGRNTAQGCWGSGQGCTGTTAKLRQRERVARTKSMREKPTVERMTRRKSASFTRLCTWNSFTSSLPAPRASL
eukprot:3134256-Rhodomonas_salina.1